MHYSKSLPTIAVITALSLLPASAEKISPEQALSRLNSSMRVPSKLKTQKPALRLAKTISTSSAEEAVYLFESQDNNSFVVMPADDLFPAVLGYGDSSLTDTDGEMAPGLEWLLDQYAAEIEYVRLNPADAEASTLIRTVSAASSSKEAIAPLLTSKWKQKAPFNNNCPKIDGDRAVTGCVATALAQVMYYYKYPAKGTGTGTYTYATSKSNTTKKSGTLDLSTITFDWENMIDSYEDSYTTKQKNAVAALMQACGAAVQANYKYKSSDNSFSTGAKTVKDVAALGENFGYSSDMNYYYKDYDNLTDEEWEDAIYGSLSRKRPVLWGGANPSTNAGHSFVCDGYSEGLYHFNWGWAGNGDGYYALSGINPDIEGNETGDGGGTIKDYNARQLIIVDVHPAEAGETFQYPREAFLGYQGDLKFSSNAFTATGSSTGFYNKAPQKAKFDIGIMAEGSDGSRYVIYSETNSEYDCGKGVASISAGSSVDLPNGNYRIYPVFRLPDSASSGDTRAADIATDDVRIMAHDNADGFMAMHVTNKKLSSGYSNSYDIITGIEGSIADNENLQIRIAAGGEGVEISGVRSTTLVSVYAADGMQAMPAVSINADTCLDLSSLPCGVYILTATSTDGTLSRRFLRR